MNETQFFLKAMMESVQMCRSFVADGIEAASEASFRKFLSQLQGELDGIESALTANAKELEIYSDELPPLSYYQNRIRNRLFLHFKNSDSAVAESIIRCCTDCMIRITRSNNLACESSINAQILFHRMIGHLNVAIRTCGFYL